jgi:single-strand DNA-binding protein
MNVFTFSGNIGSDAEQRATKAGTAVVSFSVAVKSGYGERESTIWVKCSLFGKRGESLLPYLIKGQQVVVSGEASLNTWEGKEPSRTDLEVNVNGVTLVGGRPAAKPEAPQAKAQDAAEPTGKASGSGDFDDDIPF